MRAPARCNCWSLSTGSNCRTQLNLTLGRLATSFRPFVPYSISKLYVIAFFDMARCSTYAFKCPSRLLRFDCCYSRQRLALGHCCGGARIVSNLVVNPSSGSRRDTNLLIRQAVYHLFLPRFANPASLLCECLYSQRRKDNAQPPASS